MSKFRVPRKIKKKIPVGMYCYEFVESTYSESGNWTGYKTKPCPFGKTMAIKDSPTASEYTKEELEDFGDETIVYCKIAECEIDDQCKSCGIKYGF